MSSNRPQPRPIPGVVVPDADVMGAFALQHFLLVPGVRPVATRSTHREAALATARRCGVEPTDTPVTLVRRPNADLVGIAMPPSLHRYVRARPPLQAGKHALCAKGPAPTSRQARQRVELARARGLPRVANRIRRYNPLFEMVWRPMPGEVRGIYLRARYKYAAGDERLHPDHRFGDPARSVGILLEPGGQGFDLFAGWLGTVGVVAAPSVARPDGGVEEPVDCTVRYRGDVHQLPSRFHPACLRGSSAIATVVRIRRHHAGGVDPGPRHLAGVGAGGLHAPAHAVIPRLVSDLLATYGGRHREAVGRHKEPGPTRRIELRWGSAGRRCTAAASCWVHRLSVRWSGSTPSAITANAPGKTDSCPAGWLKSPPNGRAPAASVPSLLSLPELEMLPSHDAHACPTSSA